MHRCVSMYANVCQCMPTCVNVCQCVSMRACCHDAGNPFFKTRRVRRKTATPKNLCRKCNRNRQRQPFIERTRSLQEAAAAEKWNLTRAKKCIHYRRRRPCIGRKPPGKGRRCGFVNKTKRPQPAAPTFIGRKPPGKAALQAEAGVRESAQRLRWRHARGAATV